VYISLTYDLNFCDPNLESHSVGSLRLYALTDSLPCYISECMGHLQLLRHSLNVRTLNKVSTVSLVQIRPEDFSYISSKHDNNLKIRDKFLRKSFNFSQ
jgi:hypothetical protein